MNKKKVYLITAILILILLTVLSGCNIGKDDVMPEEIRISVPEIFLAPSGESAKAKIVAEVLPKETTNKGLIYLVDTAFGEFLSVDIEGNLIARKKCSDKIPVYVTAKATSNVTTTVRVIVEEVKPTGILIEKATIEMIAKSEPKNINAKVLPLHASLFATLSYSALNPDGKDAVISVDALGNVTPLTVGHASVIAKTETDEEGGYVEKAVSITVRHAPLKYSITTPLAGHFYKQIVGNETEVSYTLLRLDNESDPNPEIYWFIGNTRINGQNSPTLRYLPTGLTIGEHTITVLLRDKSNKELRLTSSVKIQMFNPLKAIDISILNAQDTAYKTGDTILFEIAYQKGEYPPESYAWYIRDAVESGAKDEHIGNSATNKFRYTFKKEGRFIFTAKAFVKGVSGIINKSTDVYSVEVSVVGNNIHNVYIDGGVYDGNNVPMVIWDKLPQKTNFTVEITNETTDKISILSSTDGVASNYFVNSNSCIIPQDVATFGDNFSVRVKSNSYDYTNRVQYKADTIVQEYFNCLPKEFLNYNAYIANMEELGSMVNYLVNFRPKELIKMIEVEPGKSLPTISMNWYFAFDFKKLEQEIRDCYPQQAEPSDAGKYTPTMLNAYHSVLSAYFAYGDNHSFSLRLRGDGLSEIVTVTLIFTDEINEEYKKTTQTNLNTLPFIKHYTTMPRSDANNDFIINSVKEEMAVQTSNQLYLAVLNGYKPIIDTETSAYRVYLEAKKVLNRIISADMTDESKVHAIYDFLTMEVTYDKALYALSETESPTDLSRYEGFYLEGVFLRRKAVCDGIAKAFTLLCGMEGIKSYKVSGVSGPVGHAWNKTLVNGNFYVQDATWGSFSVESDAILYQTHKYLNMSDLDVKIDHTTYGLYPKSDDKALNSYFNNYTVGEGDNQYNHNIVTDKQFDEVMKYYIAIATAHTYEGSLWLELYISATIVPDGATSVVAEKIQQYVLDRFGNLTIGSLECSVKFFYNLGVRTILIELK